MMQNVLAFRGSPIIPLRRPPEDSQSRDYLTLLGQGTKGGKGGEVENPLCFSPTHKSSTLQKHILELNWKFEQ